MLHTWGSALTHHPHVHVVVPGGGLSPDGERWTPCRRGFFLPVRVLSRLFRRLFLDGLAELHAAGRLGFHGERARLVEPAAFAAHLAPLRRVEWVVYDKAPFGGPEAVLAYLSRYTHRVAISNRRLVSADAEHVVFRWKDYRAKGRARFEVMRLETAEFIRRFLRHVLPRGFLRIRHYGLLANGARAGALAAIRKLLDVAPPDAEEAPGEMEPEDDAEAPAAPGPRMLRQPCPKCGGELVVIETFERGQTPRSRAPPARAA